MDEEVLIKIVEKISQKRMKRIWNNLTSKSFPKIKGRIVDNEEYGRIVTRLRKRPGVEKVTREAEMKEYGSCSDGLSTNAFVTELKPGKYLLIIRKDPIGKTKNKVIEHELKHIISNDFIHDAKSR